MEIAWDKAKVSEMSFPINLFIIHVTKSKTRIQVPFYLTQNDFYTFACRSFMGIVTAQHTSIQLKCSWDDKFLVGTTPKVNDNCPSLSLFKN